MKQTIAVLLAYLTCDDPVVQNKYANLLDSFWHKDNGSVITSFSVNGNGDVTFNLLDGDGQADQVVIPQFVLPASMPMSFIDGLVSALNGKVDTQVGKQLSTEDFTTDLLNKLNALEPYIHPAFHEISEINGLQDILDSLQNQVDDKLPLGGYNGTAQNLKEEIDNVFTSTDIVEPDELGYSDVPDPSLVVTNVKDIATGQRKTLDQFFQFDTRITLTAFAQNKSDFFDRYIHFENNFFANGTFDYSFNSPDDFAGTTPTEFSTAYVSEVPIGNDEEYCFAYAIFDPAGDNQWVYTSLWFYDISVYNYWLANEAAGYLANPLPRGLVCKVDNGDNFSFLDSGSMSAVYNESQLFSANSAFRRYFSEGRFIGHMEMLLPGIPEAEDYLTNTQVLILDKDFISKSHIVNVYADYNQTEDINNDMRYVKQKINSVEADFKKGWLKVYSPLGSQSLYQFKNGRVLIPSGFGHIFTPIILNSIDRESEADTIENNTVLAIDMHGYISPLFDASYYLIEYELVRDTATDDDGIVLSNHSSYLSQTGPNILISDTNDTHSAQMAGWVTYYYPSFSGQVIQTNDDPGGDFYISSSLSNTYAKLNKCNIIVEAITTSYAEADGADPDLLFIAAHGNNVPTRYDRTQGPEVFFNNVILVGSGLESDADGAWQTSYGYGLEFIEPTRDEDASGQGLPSGVHQQSPATAFVAGKLKAIKDATNMSWAVVRRAARETASRAGNWDMYRGYGVIDVTAAIAWINTNYDTLNADMADRYAGMLGLNQRLAYNDIHDNTPVPKRLTVGINEAAVDPTLSDIPEGQSVEWTNTTIEETRIWKNRNGVLISSPAFT